MTDTTVITATVLNRHVNDFYVRPHTPDLPQLRCVVKGVQLKSGVEILPGDVVMVDSIDITNAMGRISSITERKNQLDRPKIANISTMVITCALTQPALDFQQLDRYLSLAYLKDLAPIICLTKKDLLEDLDPIKTLLTPYQQLGITVHMASIFEPQSVQQLLATLPAGCAVLAGPSGVGKSSLINQMAPELNLKTGEVSEKLGRGTHTTRVVSLLAMGEDLYIADTPGFSHLRLDTVARKELAQKAFPEFLAHHCTFEDCLHTPNEQGELPKGCQLIEYPETISESRYKSYIEQLAEAGRFESTQKVTSQKQRYGTKQYSGTGQTQREQVKLKSQNRAPSRKALLQQAAQWQSDEPDTEETDL